MEGSGRDVLETDSCCDNVEGFDVGFVPEAVGM